MGGGEGEAERRMQKGKSRKLKVEMVAGEWVHAELRRAWMGRGVGKPGDGLTRSHGEHGGVLREKEEFGTSKAEMGEEGRVHGRKM